MDDRVQLVFSWDPRAQTWLKERGPEDAVRPPAKPLDDGAVQTYFLDPRTGGWVATILAPKGRIIADAIGKYYRMPAVVGLDIELEPATSQLQVDNHEPRSRAPVVIALALVLAIVVGGGAVASNTLFASASADTPTADPSQAPDASAAPSPGSSTPGQTDAPATGAPTARPSGAPGTPAPTAPARTAAPTPVPQPTTVLYSTVTTANPSGLHLFYSGPGTASQGTVINVTVNAVDGNGEPYRFAIDVRIGNTGWSSMTTKGDGKYSASLPLIAARGSQAVQLNLHFGNIITPYTMGTMTVH